MSRSEMDIGTIWKTPDGQHWKVEGTLPNQHLEVQQVVRASDGDWVAGSEILTVSITKFDGAERVDPS